MSARRKKNSGAMPVTINIGSLRLWYRVINVEQCMVMITKQLLFSLALSSVHKFTKRIDACRNHFIFGNVGIVNLMTGM